MRKHETTYTYSGSGTPVFTVASPTTEYQENVSYDANGNILTYLRNGSASQLSMDNLTYRYANNYNRLTYVDDAVNAANYSVDIDDQNSGNYVYDKIGNLVSDVDEKITKIEWTAYGKIKKITKSDAALTTIEYEYDAGGNRIYKKVVANSSITHTYYVRDAQGNTMAVYTKDNLNSVKWAEQHLYGSSRTGMANMNMNVPASAPLPAPGFHLLDGFDYGKTVYEMSNHLGNVLATVSDKKNAVQNGSTGTVNYFVAVVMTQTDYYPFGMQIPGRTYRAQNGYRYGFNGKENDNEVKGVEGSQQDYGMRIYDPRIGRLLSADPKSGKYPELTPYQFASNKPINCIDLLGEQNLDYRLSANFSVSFGDNGVSFRISTGVGATYTTRLAQITSSSNLNVYNGGLGTSGKSGRVQFDVSTSVYLTMGAGNFAGSRVKTINSMTESPIDNNYFGSATIGNSYSYSSGLAGDGIDKGTNKNLFFDFKIGPLSASYSNDDRLFNKTSVLGKIIGGSGNDKSFTTSLSVTLNSDAIGLGPLLGNISYGVDIFTGVGFYGGDEAPVAFKGGVNTKGDYFYNQTNYQKSLNKSNKFLSIGGIRIAVDNGGKAQNTQHTGQGTEIFPGISVGKTDNPLFEYNQQNTRSCTITTPSVVIPISR